MVSPSLQFSAGAARITRLNFGCIAYGNTPDDAPLGAFNPDVPPAQQFRLPHNIAISRDVDDEDGVA